MIILKHLKYFKTIINKDTCNYPCYGKIAKTEAFRQNYQQAVNYYNKALESNPSDAKIWYF